MTEHHHVIPPKVDDNYDLPDNADGMSFVQDGNRALFFGFKVKREAFVHLGYFVLPSDDENLAACAKAACDALWMQAVMKGMTLTPDDVLAKLAGEQCACPAAERNAAMSVAAVRQAVMNYASVREA